ncbi:CTP synthase [Candidatus Saccharibacteria bacterium]|nr:CTP synthase [Candidatus Saccharibacteria bacterium]
MAKYIFVVGGVLSGVGKGITAASIGAILQAKGLKVSIMKCDPYLNVDASTLCPAEHGECFVTHDGRETDLDLGHYERFLDIETNKFSTILSGSLFHDLLTAEREGKFNGKTVQLVPHFTGLIQDKIEQSQKSNNSDVHIVEIGGTVGDIESLSFIEAIREFRRRVGRENCFYVHVVWVPWINTSKEFKSKPAQNALRELRGFGITPNLVCVRSDNPTDETILDKIAAFAGLDEDAVVNLPDVTSVYDVPLNLARAGAIASLDKFAGGAHANLASWESLSQRLAERHQKTVRIGIVARYLENQDVYLSALEALKAAATANQVNLEIEWIDAKSAVACDFKPVDGLFSLDSMRAVDFALQNDKPYLGVGACLGGTVKTGNNEINLQAGSRVAEAYSNNEITERARNSSCEQAQILDDPSLVVSGTSDGQPMFVEAPDRKFLIITAVSPEFRSRPMRPHPLYVEFIRSSLC